MTKILYLTRVPITAVRFILPLANRLRERGNSVQFAFGPGEGLEEMEASGFPYVVLEMEKNSKSPRNIAAVKQLKGFIRQGRYNIVHTYSPVIGVYGRIAAYLAKTPFVVHSVIGSILATGIPFWYRSMNIASEWATSYMVDLYITLNDVDACSMVRYHLASADKVVSLKYEFGVNLNEFNPDVIDPGEVRQLREKYGLEEGTPVIGFVGRMIRSKGIFDLFDAYRILSTKGIAAKLVYLGDVLSTDSDRRSYERLKVMVKELGCQQDVVFWGFRKSVPLYLSLMDVVVLPSHHEGFPRIPVEAGAMRKPSICTAIPGAEVAVAEGETGFIVPIKDPQDLAEAIQKIIVNPALALKMGNNARERVIGLFDQETIVGRQVDIYRDLFTKKVEAKNYSI